MTYSPDIPQPPDIPAEGQDDFLNNFGLSNTYFNADHVPFSGIITNASQANPAVITSPLHSLTTGNSISIFGVIGMIQLNGNTYTITVIDQNTFSLNGTDSTSFTPYISSGFYSSASLLSGYHKKITLPNNSIDPNLLAPAASIYQKQNNLIAELFYQNGNSASFIDQLTNSVFLETSTGRGIKTPWGIILNFGQVTVNTILSSISSTNVTFPIPFTDMAHIQTIIATPLVASNLQSRVAVSAIAISGSQFTGSGINSNQKTVPIFYFAIGT